MGGCSRMASRQPPTWSPIPSLSYARANTSSSKSTQQSPKSSQPHAFTMSKPSVGWIGLGAMGQGMAQVCHRHFHRPGSQSQQHTVHVAFGLLMINRACYLKDSKSKHTTSTHPHSKLPSKRVLNHVRPLLKLEKSTS